MARRRTNGRATARNMRAFPNGDIHRRSREVHVNSSST
jgi:hypothetical protein